MIVTAGLLATTQEAPQLRMEGCLHAMAFFEPDSAEIGEGSAQILRTFLEYAPRYMGPSSYYQIGGYTDRTGSQSYNLALSRRRAEAVQRFLIDAGFPAHRLLVRPYGETRSYEGEPPQFARRADVLELLPVLDRPPPPGAVLC